MQRAAVARVGWREIEQKLRNAIARREFKVGQKVPTEPQLMATYGSSRYATRRALLNLAKEGFLRIEQGRGTFVHEDYLVSYRLGERARFTTVLLEEQVTPGHEVLRIREVPAQATVARGLELDQGDAVLMMEGLGSANGEIVKRDVSYFPLPRFRAMASTLRQTRSVTEALAQHGVSDYKRCHTSIVGRLPTPAEARALRQLPTNPVFEIERIDVDLDDIPIIFGFTIFSCERVRLTLTSKTLLCPPTV